MEYPYGSGWTSWHEIITRLQEQSARQAKEAAELRTLIEELSERLGRLEARPSMNIERVEYKFDQLKVERLDGALHIGMPVSGGEQPVPGGGLPFSGTWPDSGAPAGMASPPAAVDQDSVYMEAMGGVNRYLDTEAKSALEKLETEYGVSLDPHHRSMIIEDLRSQLGPRLSYYLQPARQEAGAKVSSARRSSGEAAALTIADLGTAMRAYLSRLKG